MEKLHKKDKKLTKIQQLFVDLYVGKCRLKGADAAREAGYSEKGADRRAYALLKVPHVKAEIDKRLQDIRVDNNITPEAIKETWRQWWSDPDLDPNFRLKVTELLAKSLGMLKDTTNTIVNIAIRPSETKEYETIKASYKL